MDILPDEYKNSTRLKEFKTKIKNWVPLNCPCRLCKTYIQTVKNFRLLIQRYSQLLFSRKESGTS